MATYLLPCSCGRDLEVAGGQAGRMVRCECGRELEVPSIRGLEQLKRASTEAPQSTWGLRQATLFVGLLMLVLGLGVGIVYQIKRPTPPDYATIRAEVENWPTEQQRWYWNMMQAFGIAGVSREDVEAAQTDRQYNMYSTAGLLVASLGLVLSAASLLIPRRRAPAANQPAMAGSQRKRS